jgi:hypothetical protein
MFKKYLFFFVFLSYSISTYSQSTFQKLYGSLIDEFGFEIIRTQDGGYAFTGSSSSISFNDIIVVKTDANFNIIWKKEIGESGIEEGHGIIEATDGSIIVAGSTNTNTVGSLDLYLIKLSSTGDLIWTKSFGDIFYENDASIDITSDGNYVVAGTSFTSSGHDILIAKFDTAGNILLTKTIGSPGDDVLRKVKATPDGGYMFAGYTDVIVQNEFFLIKADSNCLPVWGKTYRVQSVAALFSADLTQDGGFILTGAGGEPGIGVPGINGILTIKTDDNGNIQWHQFYRGFGIEVSRSVISVSNGGYVITGTTDSLIDDICLIRIDQSGNVQWGKTFGDTGSDSDVGVVESHDGGFIVIGSTSSFNPTHNRNIYLIKTDTLGNSGCYANSRIFYAAPHSIYDSTFNAIVLNDTTNVLNRTPSILNQGVMNNICTTVGIEEKHRELELMVFPNPAKNNIRIRFPEKKFSIIIYDIFGKVLFNFININSENEIEFNLSSGIYFVKVIKDDIFQTVKLIVE